MENNVKYQRIPVQTIFKELLEGKKYIVLYLN